MAMDRERPERLTAWLLVGLCLATAGCGKEIVPQADRCTVHRHAATHQARTAIDETLYHVPAEYTLRLRVGTEDVEFVVDTGSSNLVVQGNHALCSTCSGAGDERYHPTEGHQVGNSFQIRYGSGSAKAAEYQDVVGLECGPPIDGYTFGVITENNDVPNILGLAYQDLAQGERPADHAQPLPPFFRQLVARHEVANEFSMLLCGHRPGSRVLLGGRDDRRPADSAYRWVPIVEESYYVVEAVALKIKDGGAFPNGQTTLALPAAQKTIIDSGTTLNLLPGDVVAQIVALMQQTVQSQNIAGLPDGFWHTTDPGSDDYQRRIAPEDVARFPTLQVVLRDTTGQEAAFDVHPDTYLKAISRDADERIFGFRASPGLTILGQVFMENGLFVFDRANKRIGIAPNNGLCGS